MKGSRMPIYDYKCKGCGETSEIFVQSSNGHQVTCPACGGTDLEKVFSSSYMIKMAQAPSGGTSCCPEPGSCGSPGSCCGS